MSQTITISQSAPYSVLWTQSFPVPSGDYLLVLDAGIPNSELTGIEDCRGREFLGIVPIVCAVPFDATSLISRSRFYRPVSNLWIIMRVFHVGSIPFCGSGGLIVIP